MLKLKNEEILADLDASFLQPAYAPALPAYHALAIRILWRAANVALALTALMFALALAVVVLEDVGILPLVKECLR